MTPTYEVIGSQAVNGTAPGESFTADLDEVQEERLVDGGQIRRKRASAKGQQPTSTEKKED